MVIKEIRFQRRQGKQVMGRWDNDGHILTKTISGIDGGSTALKLDAGEKPT